MNTRINQSVFIKHINIIREKLNLHRINHEGIFFGITLLLFRENNIEEFTNIINLILEINDNQN